MYLKGCTSYGWRCQMATIPFSPVAKDQAHTASVPVALELKGKKRILRLSLWTQEARELAGHIHDAPKSLGLLPELEGKEYGVVL